MISVIVIGKNEAARIGGCMQSIRDAMGVMLHEIVYVDSRSSDNSAAIARRWGARCFILSEEQTTAGLGRLVGTKEAQGEYLLFLDADMQLRRGFLEAAMMTMAKEGYDGATGMREDVYMKDGKAVSRVKNYFGCTAQRIAPEFGGALFIKKDALLKAGGWSADTIACEEAELHARINAAGLRIVELPVQMITHTDAVRDNRGLAGAVFSKRRLGEGQALRCAMAAGKARAYIRHEKQKFTLFAADLACLLLLLVYPALGLLLGCFAQAMQLGFFLSRKRIRAFLAQKLFFFSLPLGMLTYRIRSREYTAI